MFFIGKRYEYKGESRKISLGMSL